MRTLIVVLAGAALWLAPSTSSAQHEADVNTGQLVADAPTYQDLVPRHKQVLVRRARTIIRTPDGQFWDGWGEAAYRETYDKTLKRMRQIRNVRSEGWIYPKEGVSFWEVAESDDAAAWQIAYVAFLGGTHDAWPDELPPLWMNMSPINDQILGPAILYANEARLPAMRREFKERLFVVKDTVSPTRLMVCRRDLVKSLRSGVEPQWKDGAPFFVDVPTERTVNSRGEFRGEYIFWLGADPDTFTLAGKDFPVWQYVEFDDLRVTPQELHDAIVSGKAELFDWSWRKIGGHVLWEKSRIELEHR